MPEDLDLIKYYAEFAAAAYCEIELEPSVGWDNDTNSSYPAIPPENLVACKDNICPGVQAKGVSKVYEFAEFVSPASSAADLQLTLSQW